MTQLFEDFMNERTNWKLIVSSEMQGILDEEKKIEKAVDNILGMFDPLYPEFHSNTKMSIDICNGLLMLQNEIEKRVMRFILTESDSDSNMKHD